MQCSPLTAIATTLAILREAGMTPLCATIKLTLLPPLKYHPLAFIFGMTSVVLHCLSMMTFSRLSIESEGLKQPHSELEKVVVLPEQTNRREPLWPRFTHRHESMAE